jgi:peroxiredoxin
MAQLRRDEDRLEKLDIAVLIVGPEDAGAFRDYWEKEALPFIGLPDPKHSVIKLYGQEVKIFKFGRMPAQMLIDKDGVLRFVYYGHTMADIPGLDEIEKSLNLS